MAIEPIIVTIDAGMADLIPLFLTQRKADQSAMALALPARDFEKLRRIGHGMAGAGASYGFDQLSVLGDNMVLAGRAGDLDALARLKAELDDFLSRLVVKYM